MTEEYAFWKCRCGCGWTHTVEANPGCVTCGCSMVKVADPVEIKRIRVHFAEKIKPFLRWGPAP